jgi:hypothetical protein
MPAPRSRPPAAETRRALLDTFAGLGDRLHSVHLIISGSGLRFALVRNVLAGMMLLSGEFARKCHIHDGLERALNAVAAPLELDVAPALRFAAEHHLLPRV